MDLNDPRFAQQLLKFVDRRIQFHQRSGGLEWGYGDVFSVDTTARKCSVLLRGLSQPSPGFVYSGSAPLVGDFVRVFIDPKGDRWVDTVLMRDTIVDAVTPIIPQPPAEVPTDRARGADARVWVPATGELLPGGWQFEAVEGPADVDGEDIRTEEVYRGTFSGTDHDAVVPIAAWEMIGTLNTSGWSYLYVIYSWNGGVQQEAFIYADPNPTHGGSPSGQICWNAGDITACSGVDGESPYGTHDVVIGKPSIGDDVLRIFGIRGVSQVTGTTTYHLTLGDPVLDAFTGLEVPNEVPSTAAHWLAAPPVVDGDDATSTTSTTEEAVRIDLGASFRIVRARVVMGSESAGAKSYELRGANEGDFSDEVALASLDYTSAGSFAPNEIQVVWPSTTAYRYFRIVGTIEARRVYTVELYESGAGQTIVTDPTTGEGAELDDALAALAEHAEDPTDAHDASAVSFDPTDTGLIAEDVQAAIEELDDRSGGGAGTVPITPFDEHDLVHGTSLTRVGLVIDNGGAGSWNEDVCESPMVFWSPDAHKYCMVATGYPSSGAGGSIGVWTATTPDGPWTAYGSNPFFTYSTVSGDPDQWGVTGPYIWYEDGTYHLFYIGATSDGYEGGVKSLCHATSTDWVPGSNAGTWTRHGAVISPSGSGWRQEAIWHPSIVKRGATYFLFFNASNAGHHESIGYATSTDLDTWIVDDAESPILVPISGEGADVTDPYVYRIGGTWYMVYRTSNQTDALAFTSDRDFPLGWRRPAGATFAINGTGPGGAFDQDFAAKPCIFITTTKYYHWYTGIGNGKWCIGLHVQDISSSAVDLTGINFLVGTASGLLSNEIVVGTTPGGELAGAGTSWASPKVTTTHAGSTHVALSDATPLVEAGAGDPGDGTEAARDNHVHPVSVGLPTVIHDGETFEIPAERQALFSVPITIEAGGTLAVTGYLVEVH